MAKRLTIPIFSSETEDAAWHQKHRRELEREFARRWDEGTTFRKSGKNGDLLRQVTIRMNPSDLESIREQAHAKGMPYQTYIRSLLHKALRREASRR